MYIYHALINALSAHIIHVHLNMILYPDVEHNPTKIIYIKCYTEKQTLPGHALHTHTHTHDCSRFINFHCFTRKPSVFVLVSMIVCALN